MRRILFTLCLLVMLPLAVLAGPTLSNGDTITISSGSNYLGVNSSNAITNYTSVSNNSKWVVLGTAPDFQLKNVATNRYLGNGRNSNSTTLSTHNSATRTWTYDQTNGVFIGNNSSYHFSYNNSWNLSNSGTAAIVTLVGEYQAVINFQHQQGASGRGWQTITLANGSQKNIQGVHTYTQIVYVASGETKNLSLPETDFRGYCRWYDFTTDKKSSQLQAPNNNFTKTTEGYIYLGKADNAPFIMPTQAQRYTIACDLSNYTDYNGSISRNGTLTEPTLSYRAIFDVRPASEIVAQINSATQDNPYETHKIIAPSGKTLNLALNHRFEDYYISDDPNYKMNNESSWHIRLRGETNDVRNSSKESGRLFRLTLSSSQTSGTNIYDVTYEFNNVTYYIASFEVTIVPANKTISNGNVTLDGYDQATLQRTYQYDPANNILPATQDFESFYDQATNKMIPLPWDECSYGFAKYDGVIRNAGDGPSGHTKANATNSSQAYWGEYSLLSGDISASFIASEYQNPETNTFMYIDAADAPGIIADLKIDGQLCDGAKMLFMARIADVGNGQNQTRANLNFEVTGIKFNPAANEQAETPITTFTTGDVTYGGDWYQYVFELVRNDNTTYDEFRLKIVNNGKNHTGNDFAIDDIQIWKGKAPVLPYQGKVNCSNNTDKITSVVRVNYTNTVASNTDFYYQWRDESNINTITRAATPLELNYLVNPQTTGKTDLGKKYGKIGHNLFKAYPDQTFEQNKLNQEGGYFESLSQLITTAENNTSTSDMFYGYVTETVNGSSAYVLYIVHVTDLMKKGTDYTVELVAADGNKDPAFGRQAQGACGFQSAITINVPQALSLDGQITYKNDNGNLCAQQIHTLQPIIKINVVDDDAQEVNEVEGICRADWLKFDLAKIPSHYNSTIINSTSIVDAQSAFRTEYPTISNIKSALPKGSLSPAQLQVMQTLVADGYMVLYENNHNEYLNAGESIDLTIFPINGTVTAKDGSTLKDKYGNDVTVESVCLGQMTATISAKSQPTGTLKFGKNDSNYPDDKVATTRLYTEEISKSGIFMGIRNMTNVKITKISLIPDFTTDPAITSTIDLLNEAESKNFNATNGLTIPANKLTGVTFKEGYEYAIEAEFSIQNGDDPACQNGTNYFLVKVTPHYAQWAPMGGNTAWNNDANWITIGADGKEIHNAGFIPGNKTNVIIAKEANGVYPILPTASNGKENGYQKDVEWDYNFANATAQDIYFEVGTMMGNQQTLDYNDAYVDMALPSTRWTLAGMPMQSMVSGDFNVPTSEMDGHAPFTVTNYDGNYTVQFWQNLYYNTTAYNVGWSGVDNATNVTRLENINWTTNFNGVKQLYTPGTAAAVWPVDDRKNDADNYDVVVSLPGKETTLYYYSYGNPTGIGESIDRTNNTKLAYPQTTYTLNSQANDEYVVFGNPTMAYIDLNSFLTRNSSVLANEYTYWYGNVNTLDWTSYTNNGSANATALPSEIVEGYLAPMRGIMLKKANASATSVTITIDPTDLTTTPPAAPATPTASSLFITAKCADHISHASVVEGSDADNGYNANEDAKAIRIDNDFTPSVLYTVGGEKALSINSLSNINNVPVAVLTEQTTSATLSFEGADSFNGKLYLHDAQANTSTLITNEDKITITTTRSGEPIRYFIQKVADETTAADVTTNDGINIFVQPDGSITVASNDMLTEVNVYNGAGQRILHQTANNQFVGLSLPAGVYAIQAVSTNESKTQKVVVK